MRNLSRIKCRDGNEYIIIQYKRSGYEKVCCYAVHLFDKHQRLIDSEPILEIYAPFVHKKRYNLITRNFLSIIAYALASGKIVPGTTKKLTLNFDRLDKIYRAMLKEYYNNTFDSGSIMRD